MSTMTRKKRRLRRTFRRRASIVFWTSPLWSFPAAFAAIYKGFLPIEPALVLVFFVGVIPAMVWAGIRLIGVIAVRMTKDEHRHYDRMSKPLEIRPGSEPVSDENGEAQRGQATLREVPRENDGPPPANAAIN